MLYTYDIVGNFTGEHEHVKGAPVPRRYTRTAPPEGDGHPVHRGNGWELWDEPAPQPFYDPAIARLAEIERELAELDMKTIRPLRAKLADTATQEDTDVLNDLETQAQTLRNERKDLEDGRD